MANGGPKDTPKNIVIVNIDHHYYIKEHIHKPNHKPKGEKNHTSINRKMS